MALPAQRVRRRRRTLTLNRKEVKWFTFFLLLKASLDIAANGSISVCVCGKQPFSCRFASRQINACDLLWSFPPLVCSSTIWRLLESFISPIPNPNPMRRREKKRNLIVSKRDNKSKDCRLRECKRGRRMCGKKEREGRAGEGRKGSMGSCC